MGAGERAWGPAQCGSPSPGGPAHRSFPGCRLSDGVERCAEPQQLELQYVCAGDELEDACPPLLCTLP